MKKFIWVFFGFFVLCCGVLGFSYFKLNSLAKFAIEEAGSRVLKTKVEVSRVALMPFSGKGAIYGLKIHNPPGFTSPYAFSVGKVEVHVNLPQLKNNIVEVTKVDVENPTIWYEGISAQNNFTKIQNNAQASAGRPDPNPTPGTKSNMSVVMKEFWMRKSQVNLVNVVPMTGMKTVELEEIHFMNDGKMSQADLMAKISGMIASNAAKMGMRSLASPDAIKKQVLEKVKIPDGLPPAVSDKLKKLF
jgi:hypothetical protein